MSLGPLRQGDIFYATVIATSGDLTPILILEDQGGIAASKTPNSLLLLFISLGIDLHGPGRPF